MTCNIMKTKVFFVSLLSLQLTVGCLAFSTSQRQQTSAVMTSSSSSSSRSSSSPLLVKSPLCTATAAATDGLLSSSTALNASPADKNDNDDDNDDLSNREELLKYLDSDLSISFQEYQTQQRKYKYLAECPIFAKQSTGDRQRLSDSMELIQVSKGETVIQQGLTGDDMFFLVNGKLECIDEDTEKHINNKTILLTTYDKEGQYFGEVSLLFGGPRMASIIALEDSTLYRLNKQAFRDSMVDTQVYDTARDMMLKKYTSSRLRDVILKLSSGEIMDLLRAKLQPQKQLVSVESRLRLFAWGAASSLLVGALAPGFDVHGWPKVYDVTNPFPTASALLASSLFSILSFVSTSSDTKITASNASFSKKWSVEWLSFGFWLVGASNLSGNLARLDAWGAVPRFLLTISMVGSVRNSVATILSSGKEDDGAYADDDSAPTSTSKNVLLAAATLGLANIALLLMASPILSTFDLFQIHALPNLITSPGLVPYLCIAGQLLLSFFAPGAHRPWMALATPWVAFDAIKFGVQALVVTPAAAKSYVSCYFLPSLLLWKQWMTLPPIVAAWFVCGKIQSMRMKTVSTQSAKVPATTGEP